MQLREPRTGGATGAEQANDGHPREPKPCPKAGAAFGGPEVPRMARFVIAIALLATLAAIPSASASAEDPVARVIELTNVERQKQGLGPVQPNPQLAQAAQSYAQVLASSDCFAHSCGPVPSFTDRSAQAGYSGWTERHENLAGGQRSPEDAVAVWMASPPHRAALLCAACNEIGVGVAEGGRYGINWVQELGARSGASSGANQPRFVLGFKYLADQIPATAGSPIENERHDPANGDGLQQTTRGLFVWRKSDNRTAFTDGRRTWIVGPYGVQVRLNTERFLWEH